jgi:hypothetical protein
MRIQETLLSLERGIHLADMLGLNDADLNRLERACYQWQQAAAIELCRRAGMRHGQEGLSMTIGAGKTSPGVAYAEAQSHVI